MVILDFILFSILMTFISTSFFFIFAAMFITVYVLKRFHVTVELKKNKTIYLRQVKISVVLGVINGLLIATTVIEKFSDEVLIHHWFKDFLQTIHIRVIAHSSSILFFAILMVHTYFTLKKHIGDENSKKPTID